MSVRTVITTKTERNRCWQGCGEIGAPVHCWWEFKMQKSGAVPPKLNTELPYYPAVLLTRMYPRRTESREPPRCYAPVPTSRIPSSQMLKTNQMLIDTWTDTPNAVYSHNGVLLLSLQKQGHSDACYNMDEAWGRSAKWTKPVTKGRILYGSACMRYIE